MRWLPKGGACPRAGQRPDPGGGERRSIEEIKREGWLEQGLLVVDAEDQRLTPDQVRGRLWPERELIRQLGERLYGRRASQEAHHG